MLLLLASFLCLLSAAAVAADGVASDEAALLSLRRSIWGDPSGILSGWDPSTVRHCRWRGVTCDPSTRRVVAVNFTSGNLSGDFPASISGLSELRVLSLHGNNFSGPIPGNITASLPSLRVLDLSRNSFSGGIPVICSAPCQSLTLLKLSNNLLTGRIPPEIANCSALRTLLLDGNILEGNIPADIGRLNMLRVLDLSKNSLTGRIPPGIADCRELVVLVLTNLDNSDGREEFNAFAGSIPEDILSIPALEILWAPRANVDGQLPDRSIDGSSCSLKMLNLGQNYIVGSIPEWLVMCRSLMLLDLSSNYLQGSLPWQLGVGCMLYLNISRNSFSGSLVGVSDIGCLKALFRDTVNGLSMVEEELVGSYSRLLLRSSYKVNPDMDLLDDEEDDLLVFHDFSWNNFSGTLPLFTIAYESPFSYGLYVNNNGFNGSFPEMVLEGLVRGFAVNFSANNISSKINMTSTCLRMKSLEAASNQLVGSIPSDIARLSVLSRLDLRGNLLNGTIPDELGELKAAEYILLGGNGLLGKIPDRLSELSTLKVLDLSKNSLVGSIPPSLANATDMEVLLLDHNQLSGGIPPCFSALAKLNKLDVSFNNLSGSIPRLAHFSDCKFFVGNSLLQHCSNSTTFPAASVPSIIKVPVQNSRKKGLNVFVIAAVASAAAFISILFVLVAILICGRWKLVTSRSLKKKILVTFTDAPAELSYDNVVSATGNFSIQNLIGTGGFGATYKAEPVPGFFIAVKKLYMGRFQGLQQFDAEIRTLGRIRHKNLVTLIGYYTGEGETTFLIYNYLSGGNLEAFIQNTSTTRAVDWPVIHKIALDVAQAMSYLHYSCVPRIVHRDIKPSNILLDDKANAYLSDFGLARLLEVSATHATTDVAGTFGYVAPEYATTCRVSDKADVYSFGVVLLELISGKRSLDPSFSEYGNGFTIVTWGRLVIQEARVGELFAPGLWEAGPKEQLIEMARLALSCTVEVISIRPTMKQVVEALKQLKS